MFGTAIMQCSDACPNESCSAVLVGGWLGGASKKLAHHRRTCDRATLADRRMRNRSRGRVSRRFAFASCRTKVQRPRIISTVRKPRADRDGRVTAPQECPRCGCPFFKEVRGGTMEVYGAWRDTDGTWYYGPAGETITLTCANAACRWSRTTTRNDGKVVSVVEDRI